MLWDSHEYLLSADSLWKRILQGQGLQLENFWKRTHEFEIWLITDWKHLRTLSIMTNVRKQSQTILKHRMKKCYMYHHSRLCPALWAGTETAQSEIHLSEQDPKDMGSFRLRTDASTQSQCCTGYPSKCSMTAHVWRSWFVCLFFLFVKHALGCKLEGLCSLRGRRSISISVKSHAVRLPWSENNSNKQTNKKELQSASN